MKTIFFATVFSCITALLQAQGSNSETTDSLEVKVIALPDSSSIAAPSGKLVSAEIGPAGGTISSADGEIQLIFPADALTEATKISIQSAECLLPNGNKAYRFEPSGIQFQKPVQLIFQYSDEEAAVCPPELKFMALQDHKGRWEYLEYKEWDSATRSLKGFISHFSVYVDGNEVALDNTEITLKTGKTHEFVLSVIRPISDAQNTGDDLPPIPAAMARGNRQALWKVNKQTGGSAKHGTIAPVSRTSVKARYTAPAKLTTDSIVVQLELNEVIFDHIMERRGRRPRERTVRRTPNLVTLTCKVKLYSEYKVTVSQHIKENGAEMSDSTVFRLRIGLEDKASISDIQNQLAKVHIRQDRCRATYVNAATCVGMINVTGIKTSNIMPTPDGFARVHIFFMDAPMVYPVIHFPPCGPNLASKTTPPAVMNKAFPMWLDFEAKNETQNINILSGQPVRRRGPEDVIATIEPVSD